MTLSIFSIKRFRTISRICPSVRVFINASAAITAGSYRFFRAFPLLFLLRFADFWFDGGGLHGRHVPATSMASGSNASTAGGRLRLSVLAEASEECALDCHRPDLAVLSVLVLSTPVLTCSASVLSARSAMLLSTPCSAASVTRLIFRSQREPVPTPYLEKTLIIVDVGRVGTGGTPLEKSTKYKMELNGECRSRSYHPYHLRYCPLVIGRRKPRTLPLTPGTRIGPSGFSHSRRLMQ